MPCGAMVNSPRTGFRLPSVTEYSASGWLGRPMNTAA